MLRIRGGARVYYVAMQPYISDGGGAPLELGENFTNSLTNGVPAFSFPRPFPGTAYLLGGTSETGMDPDFRTPYSTQYNLTVEKQAAATATTPASSKPSGSSRTASTTRLT